MRIEIDFTKGIRENAESYYALSKKAKKKLLGLEKGTKEISRKMAIEASKKGKEIKAVKKRERRWFEKYHWFFTGEGFLVVAGRDAKSNEVVVKKLMDKNDVYFHADIHGAPHTILKTEGRKPGKDSLAQAAVFAAVFSKAWEQKLPSVDVYSARPEQVSKSAPTGESIGTGAFMIYGEREWYKKTPLSLSIGFKQTDGALELFSGPPQTVEKKADFSMRLSFGDMPKGEGAKRLLGIFRSKLGKNAQITIDDVIALLPNGGIAFSLQ
ncbi:MAG TPA: NFACT RNA binding domain-containing protein [archaeon]|nr:NFACT RNA binding domain-containing protein [archaeon]